jgi:rhodanese-related sulfurtransferase
MTPITAEQLQSMQDRNEGLLLINTLPEKDFGRTKIPGATNIPQDREDFVDRVEEAGGLHRAVVVYCASAACDSSTQAARKLEQAGFNKVFDFEGGHEEWRQYQQKAPAHAAASGR